MDLRHDSVSLRNIRRFVSLRPYSHLGLCAFSRLIQSENGKSFFSSVGYAILQILNIIGLLEVYRQNRAARKINAKVKSAHKNGT